METVVNIHKILQLTDIIFIFLIVLVSVLQVFPADTVHLCRRRHLHRQSVNFALQKGRQIRTGFLLISFYNLAKSENPLTARKLYKTLYNMLNDIKDNACEGKAKEYLDKSIHEISASLGGLTTTMIG